MTRQPMFTPIPNDPDGAFLISPAGVLLLLGHTASEPESPTSASERGRESAKRVMERILAAATAGGFKHAQVLETMLGNGEVSPRVKELAQAAIDAAGERLIPIIQSLKEPHHD